MSIERELYRKFKNESANKNEDAVDLSTLGDSIEDWKTAASVITASNERWVWHDYSYEISDPDGKYYFEAGDEDGIYSIATAVGDEVREFDTREEFFDFLEEIGLTTVGLFAKSYDGVEAGWTGNEYSLKYDLPNGYIHIVTTSSKLELHQVDFRFERATIQLNINAPEIEVRKAIENAAENLGASKDDARMIAKVCPLHTLSKLKENETNAWAEFKFHDILRYDIADGYVGVYAFDSGPAQIQVAAIKGDTKELSNMSFGLDDQAKIREFIEKAAKLLGASDQDAKTIAETCPLETLYVYTDYPELK
jgi:hypothetical protein